MVRMIRGGTAEPPSGVAPALSLIDLGMTYRDSVGSPLEVVRGLTVYVSPGEMCCLAGRSGSGKTTVMMIAAGLLAPTSGFVRWGELNVASLRDDRLTRERGARIGIVFQNAALIPTLRSAENIALSGMVSDKRRESASQRTRTLLEMVGLADRARHFPPQLSGGEQQRVALARALFGDPPLLLADEPTANLDRRTADDIIMILLALREEGRALLVATHDPAIAAAADRVVAMD